MDSDPNRNVSRTDLSGELGSVPAPRETDPTPAVTGPSAGPSSATVTRSRARGGRGMSVEPEIEFRPEVEFRQEIEIPAETCEGGLGPLDQLPTSLCQYIIADKPEVTASYTSREVTNSFFSIQYTQTAPVHTLCGTKSGYRETDAETADTLRPVGLTAGFGLLGRAASPLNSHPR